MSNFTLIGVTMHHKGKHAYISNKMHVIEEQISKTHSVHRWKF